MRYTLSVTWFASLGKGAATVLNTQRLDNARD
jgi:hypothetical protein